MLEVEFSFQAHEHAVGTSKHAALLIGLNDQCSMLLIYVQMIKVEFPNLFCIGEITLFKLIHQIFLDWKVNHLKII